MSIEIAEVGLVVLEAYESVGIGFRVTSRIALAPLRASGGTVFIEEPSASRWKDYDECEEDRPTVLPTRWDMSHWGVFAAYDGSKAVGGVIVARETPAMDMLEGRTDLALIVDLRVAHDHRGRGIGTMLFGRARTWGMARGCSELRVETQDTNVAACRFYAAMGCGLLSIDEHGYEGLDEAKLVWRTFL